MVVTMQQEYKSWQDFMGKKISREFYKRLKFDYTTKWCQHKPESVLENEDMTFYGILKNRSTNPNQKTKLNAKKNLTCHLVNLSLLWNIK